MLDYILWSVSEYNVNTMVQNDAFSNQYLKVKVTFYIYIFLLVLGND